MIKSPLTIIVPSKDPPFLAGILYKQKITGEDTFMHKDNNRKQLIINLEGNPPSWAYGEKSRNIWYYENSLAEHWIATVEDNKIKITGLDIDWRVIELDLEMAKKEKERLRSQVEADSVLPTVDKNLPLSQVIFNKGEMYWLIGVLENAIIKLD